MSQLTPAVTVASTGAGFAATIVGNVLAQEPWSESVKKGIIVGLCFASAVGTSIATGHFVWNFADAGATVTNISQILTATGTGAMGALVFFKGSLDKINSATSATKGQPPDKPLTMQDIEKIVGKDSLEIIAKGLISRGGGPTNDVTNASNDPENKPTDATGSI